MRKRHVYFSRHIGGINEQPNPNFDSLEFNKYGYTLNIVRWLFNRICNESNTYNDVIIKHRYPAGGCVERTHNSFDIAAPKETWDKIIIDYAKEFGNN